AGFAGRGTTSAISTERHTLAPTSDPRRSLGSANLMCWLARAAALVLDLDGHVLDLELARAQVRHGAQDGSAVAVVAPHGVRRERIAPSREPPHVEIVPLVRAGHPSEGTAQRLDVDVRGPRLHEYVDRLAHQRPRAEQDEGPDAGAGHGVRR